MRWLAALTALMLPIPAAASPRWAAELRLGTAWNVPLPLTIRQEGAPDVRMRGRFGTHPFELPVYYDVRLARWDRDRAWALGLTHHKLYLTDPPPEVREFAISHGYNLLMIQRLARGSRALTGAGAGVVIAHPESEVRGRRLDEGGGMFGGGYYVAGPALDALVGLAPPSAGRFYLTAEVRATLAYARVPVAGGSASVPNAAVHVTLGLGWAEPP